MGQLFFTQTPQGILGVSGGVLSATPPLAGSVSATPPPAWVPAISGIVAGKLFTVQDAIEKAWRRCKLTPDELTHEWQDTARQSLLLRLTALANEGIPLWKVGRVILPCRLGQESVQTPVGSVDVLNLNYRNYTDWGLTSLLSSTAGGVVANLIDRLMNTNFIQTSLNGAVVMDSGSGNTIALTIFGLMSYQNQYYQLVIDRSSDGNVWTNVVTLPQMLFPDSQFVWFDVDGALPYRFWRVRETGGNTLSLIQLVFGAAPTAVPMGKENRDTFSSLTNRTFQASNPAIWYFDKQHQPIIHIWPTVNNMVMHLEAWIEMQIDDLGDPSAVLDVPQRWYDATCWDLAADLAAEHPKVDDNRENKILSRRKESKTLAWSHENDFGPVRISPDISAYTR